jgi:aldose 1-epimerase
MKNSRLLSEPPASHVPTARRGVTGILLACSLAGLAAAPAWSADAAESAARPRELAVRSEPFGRTGDGRSVELYTLTNARGLVVRVMTYGATLIAVEAPDRAGRFANVTLYLDRWEDYLAGHPSLGSTVGRYANRIAHARFVIDGREFKISENSPPHHIHGGRNGFSKLVWEARPLRDKDSVGVELSLTSPDGDEGYPGTLKVRALYRLNNAGELTMEYFAETDRPTHVNLTNHAYWNLGGAGSGDVLDHLLTLQAGRYLPSDERKIPTGELAPVKGTPMDFTRPRAVGERIKEAPGGGYDHCYVINHQKPGDLALTARVEDPQSGRVMEVLTTQPGVQFYTGNYLTAKLQAGGRPYGPHHGLCLETQGFPDSPNKPHFPSTLLRPGQRYHHVTVHRFSVKP